MWKSVLSLFPIPGHAPQRLTIKRVKREYLQKKHLQDAVVADQIPRSFSSVLMSR
ncbi:predicted protein [Brucella suis bv. 3 str. 686]|uniref:Uncharacterized protein n=1 Tax=Brucella canis (strain ATCC 23365 / NCTC 10854 / RM-666) TaxID=483179 RepID=A9MB39_BRUC2|nr:Hypothetical protein, conserved [Brucella canis ATCC 23365]EEY32665.1 predicted protein [Brucella suis bv. 3 str. 686]CDL76422.1 unnamed protein product [Brucella canis str. Oliveri]